MNNLRFRNYPAHTLMGLLLLLLGPVAAWALPPVQRSFHPLNEQWTLANGPRQALLLEMYTAQNCPACPMGEAWLDSYTAYGVEARGQLWRSVVPVVWHVTYFDRPGLADPLGLYDATLRQEYLSQYQGQEEMGTPSFYANGMQWQGLGLGQGEPDLPEASVGSMSLTNSGQPDQGMTVEFTPAQGFEPQAYRGEMRGWLVLQVTGVYTDPRHGPDASEPRASKFAVQAWSSARMTFKDGKWSGAFDPLPVAAIRQKWPDAQLSIAAWVTGDAYAFQPLQAVGAWVK